jgi:hypothetical protein
VIFSPDAFLILCPFHRAGKQASQHFFLFKINDAERHNGGGNDDDAKIAVSPLKLGHIPEIQDFPISACGDDIALPVVDDGERQLCILRLGKRISDNQVNSCCNSVTSSDRIVTTGLFFCRCNREDRPAS